MTDFKYRFVIVIFSFKLKNISGRNSAICGRKYGKNNKFYFCVTR